MSTILGISALHHDAAAALVVDGVPVAAIQEERLSGAKNDPRLPVRAMRGCFAAAGVDPRAMAQAFARIDRESKDLPGALEYISTHPSTASRIEAAKRAAGPATKQYTPVLSPHEWKQIQESCYSAVPIGKGK